MHVSAITLSLSPRYDQTAWHIWIDSIYDSPIHSGQIAAAAAAQNGDPHDNAYADRLESPRGAGHMHPQPSLLDSSHRQVEAAPTAMQGPGGE
jgi:hypothetical protein